MANLTENDPLFKQHMGAFFYDMLRASGITMQATNALERIRGIGERMAAVIEHAAERKSVLVVQRLQIAVVDAFNQVEKKIDNINALASAHHSLIHELKSMNERANREIEDLKSRLAKLEGSKPCTHQFPSGTGDAFGPGRMARHDNGDYGPEKA
jgi:hypothetical protein